MPIAVQVPERQSPSDEHACPAPQYPLQAGGSHSHCATVALPWVQPADSRQHAPETQSRSLSHACKVGQFGAHAGAAQVFACRQPGPATVQQLPDAHWSSSVHDVPFAQSALHASQTLVSTLHA